MMKESFSMNTRKLLQLIGLLNPPSVQQSVDATSFKKYKCGRFEIELPHDHKLPDYQQIHRLYDRFLPVLASCLPENSLVIDVGANVGDTYASMLSENEELAFHCFEPDPSFFSFLIRNADQIGSKTGRKHRDSFAKAFVGAGNSNNGELISENGSAKVIKNPEAANTIHYIRLDDYLNSAGLADDALILVKSDVDGYDFDVIESMGDYLRRPQTIFFFEAQCFTAEQLIGFSELAEKLSQHGFQFTIFDNFGTPIHAQCSSSQIINLLNYAWHQQTAMATRTLWYFDVLATSGQTSAIGSSALQAYKTRFSLN